MAVCAVHPADCSGCADTGTIADVDANGQSWTPLTASWRPYWTSQETAPLSRMERDKGARIEREIVDAHRKMGVKAERYPLSGATRFRGSGHDIDVYAFGNDEAPLVTEVKARKEGEGFALLVRWLGDYDALFLRRNHADPMVVVPWRVWARLLNGKDPDQVSKTRHAAKPEESPRQTPQEMT